jgi:hypothetical protein
MDVAEGNGPKRKTEDTEMTYQVIDTDNDTVLIDRVDGSYEDAVRAALERCDTGDLTMDEAVAEYLASPNASEAYGVSIKEVR